jgi:hypothetical protein
MRRHGGALVNDGWAKPVAPLRPVAPSRQMGMAGPPTGFHWHGHHRRNRSVFFNFGFAAPVFVVEQPIYNAPDVLDDALDEPQVDPVQAVVERPILISTGCRTTRKLVHNAWRRVEVCHPTIHRF